MAGSTVSPGHDARQVAALLALPEIIQFVSDLDDLRWTGRPGNGSRVLVGAMLVKAVYALPTMTRTARLIAEHAALRDAIGGAPSQWACYRFATKLREHGDALARCIDAILAKLRDTRPGMGKTVAIDGSDLPAYANGQRFVKRGGELRKRFADPDATWGHRSSISTRSGGGYYGYKVHAAVCTIPGCRSRGRSRRPRTPSFRSCRPYWIRLPGAASGRTCACWTAVTTPRSSTRASRAATCGR